MFGIYAYAHFDTSVFRLCLLIKYFSFILLHLFSDCNCFWNIFLLLWCICFHIAIAHRFHISGFNIHMASIHGDRIGFTFFSIIIYKMFWSRISWWPDMGLFFPYLWKCVFFVALTSSTRLECWIYMVLMNLQDIGQTGIEVAQREGRAIAVQVCGLNPAGWSILLTHGLQPYLWQFYASASMKIAIFVFCYSTMWSNTIFLWHLSKRIAVQRFFIITLWFANNSHGSFLPHYGWSQDIFLQQPYNCVSYEMSHEANHIYFLMFGTSENSLLRGNMLL
jgi:hypothetical protein